MTAPINIDDSNIQPLPPGHRGVTKNIPIEILIELRLAKKLSYQQIARIAGCSSQNVQSRLRRAGIETLPEFRKNKDLVFENLQQRVLSSIDDEDVKKSPFGSRVLAIAQLEDKIRLLRNQSTQNVDVYAKVQSMEQELSEITRIEAQLTEKPVKIYKKKCRVCGKTYESHARQAKYCSDTCRKKAYERRKKRYPGRYRKEESGVE